MDIDLLVSDGTMVSCFETKQNASGLKLPQVRKVMAAPAELGARPGITAVEGELAPELIRLVEEARGRVLTDKQLLD